MSEPADDPAELRGQGASSTPNAAGAERTPDAGTFEDGAELLDDGQEEVFSRTAVELGRIEHHPSEES